MPAMFNGENFKRLDFTSDLNTPSGSLEPNVRDDITGNEYVIDDMEPKVNLVGPHRYSVLATDNSNQYSVARTELIGNNRVEFLCSFGNEPEARAYVKTLNERVERAKLELKLRISRLISRLIEDNLPNHFAIAGSMAAAGFDQLQEFQSLINEHRNYDAGGSQVPFVLSETFARLSTENRLTRTYEQLDSLLVCYLLGNDVNVDELAGAMVDVLLSYRLEG